MMNPARRSPTGPSPGGHRISWGRRPAGRRGFVSGATLLVLFSAGHQDAHAAPDTERDQALHKVVSQLVAQEMQQKALPGLAVVAMDRGRVVLSSGYGMSDVDQGIAASDRTMFRVGSVSKLFTDLALMQLVEGGVIDLDQPVSSYLPTFAPHNPFGVPITVRMLASHRSGLVREPPVGNYFDASAPSLLATVDSLNETALVYAPGTRNKYSNAALAVLGRLIEHVSGEPFADHIKRTILQPFGMDDSSFDIGAYEDGRIARATMWSHDGRSFDAPLFPLGMSPAGDLVSSAKDVGQFLLALDRSCTPVIGRETFREMCRGQFGDETATGPGGGMGIGFVIGDLDGKKTIGHDGAVYGFSTSLVYLPGDRIGCAVFSCVDLTNAVTGRIAKQVVRWIAAQQAGLPLSDTTPSQPIATGRAQALDGIYESASGARVTLLNDDGRLVAEIGSTRGEVRDHNGSLVLDDRHVADVTLTETEDGSITVRGVAFKRVDDPLPTECPAGYRELLGEYGFDHNILFVYERGGALHALIEWFEIDRLIDQGDSRFLFPGGMYHGEELGFERGPDGRVNAAVLAGIRFPRRPISDPQDDFFSIEPVRPIHELREEALRATPPVEAPPEGTAFRATQLIDVLSEDVSLWMDIRYASERNFMRTRFYTAPRAFMQADAAAALARVQRSLARHGLGLKIHDGYRPWYVTKMFFEATPEEDRHFVADPALGSRHNRGCAVDLTLVDTKRGVEVGMGGLYDEMTERSYPNYPVATDRERWYRKTLRRAMEAEGFRVYAYEWWHFDFNGWEQYRIGNARFEDL